MNEINPSWGALEAWERQLFSSLQNMFRIIKEISHSVIVFLAAGWYYISIPMNNLVVEM